MWSDTGYRGAAKLTRMQLKCCELEIPRKHAMNINQRLQVVFSWHVLPFMHTPTAYICEFCKKLAPCAYIAAAETLSNMAKICQTRQKRRLESVSVTARCESC